MVSQSLLGPRPKLANPAKGAPTGAPVDMPPRVLRPFMDIERVWIGLSSKSFLVFLLRFETEDEDDDGDDNTNNNGSCCWDNDVIKPL